MTTEGISVTPLEVGHIQLIPGTEGHPGFYQVQLFWRIEQHGRPAMRGELRITLPPQDCPVSELRTQAIKRARQLLAILPPDQLATQLTEPVNNDNADQSGWRTWLTGWLPSR